MSRLKYKDSNGVDQVVDIVSIADTEFATKITASGGFTYIGEARPPGTKYASRALHEAAPDWRVQRVDAAGSTIYADGNENFDNVATDLTILSFAV